MFTVRFDRQDRVRGGWKTTICQILHVYEYRNKQYEELVAEGKSFWNDEQDKYDYKIGKREALIRAYLEMPKSAQLEFIEWLRTP